jgi:hypothetical protein
MVIRDTSINPYTLAGVGEKETTHALDGTMVITEKTTVASKEDTPVVITEEIKGKNASANITIDEAWLTFLSSTKTVTYLGPGISTRDRYENNGDVICTSFDVKGITKESRFDTVLLRNNVSAEITPGHVNETILTNKSSSYVLNSNSFGTAHVGWRSGEGDTTIESSEDYIGAFQITTGIKMKEEMPPLLPTLFKPPSEWMPCPSSESEP